MSKYLGLFNIIFFSLTITLLSLSSPGYSLIKYSISNLAAYPGTGNLFKISLFLFSVIQVIYAIYLCDVFKKYLNFLAKPSFLIGAGLLCLASLFSVNVYPNIHLFLAVISVIFVCLGVILLGLALLKLNVRLGIFLLVITAFLPLIFIQRNRFPGGTWEIPIFSIIYLWNLTFSYFLLKKQSKT
jgi:hypothetical protein